MSTRGEQRVGAVILVCLLICLVLLSFWVGGKAKERKIRIGLEKDGAYYADDWKISGHVEYWKPRQ